MLGKEGSFMANNRLVSHTADRAVRETIQKKIDAKIDQKLQKSDANKPASAFEALKRIKSALVDGSGIL